MLRKLLILISLVIILLVIAVVAVCLMVNPNDLKPVLIKQVAAFTGYQLTIDGDLHWSFYPQLSIKANHMLLRAPNQSQVFADLADVKIATSLLQLLHGRQKLTGDIYVSAATLGTIKLQHAHIGLNWQDNILTFQPVTASAYKGSLQGVVHASNLATIAKWDGNMELTNLQIKPFLQDLTGKHNKININGVAHLTLQAKTTGNTQQTLLSHLTGQGQLAVSNGVLEGIDINYYVRMADAIINGKAAAMQNTGATTFSSLSSSFSIANGVLATTNLQLNSPVFLTQGVGKINLLNQTLNFELQVQSQQGLRTRWQIPVNVSGQLANPAIKVDMAALQKILLQREVVKIKDKAADELKKLPNQANQFLQNLLGK